MQYPTALVNGYMVGIYNPTEWPSFDFTEVSGGCLRGSESCLNWLVRFEISNKYLNA